MNENNEEHNKYEQKCKLQMQDIQEMNLQIS